MADETIITTETTAITTESADKTIDTKEELAAEIKSAVAEIIDTMGDFFSEISEEAADEWITELKAHLNSEAANTDSAFVKARDKAWLLLINVTYSPIKLILRGIFNGLIAKVVAKAVAKL